MGYGPVSSRSAISLACILACLVVKENFLNNVHTPMGLTAKYLCQFLCGFVFCYLLSARQCHELLSFPEMQQKPRCRFMDDVLPEILGRL
jgi:hypothetical protein